MKSLDRARYCAAPLAGAARASTTLGLASWCGRACLSGLRRPANKTRPDQPETGANHQIQQVCSRVSLVSCLLSLVSTHPHGGRELLQQPALSPEPPEIPTTLRPGTAGLWQLGSWSPLPQTHPRSFRHRCVVYSDATFSRHDFPWPLPVLAGVMLDTSSRKTAQSSLRS